MRSVRGGILLTVLTLSLAAPTAAQGRPRRIGDRDLVVAGLPHGADTAAVRAVLGAPDSVVSLGENEEGATLTRWAYPRIRIDFDQHGRRYFATWSTPHFRTARGVGIGTSRARVLALYGPPAMGDTDHVVYERHGEAVETRGITFRFIDDKVSEITVGEVIAVD